MLGSTLGKGRRLIVLIARAARRGCRTIGISLLGGLGYLGLLR